MADYLTDEEQAERLKQWWEKNGTSLVVGLVLAVAAVVGWRYYQGYVGDRALAASAAFTAYLDARDAAQPVAELLRTIDEDHVGTAYHVFALLYRAADQVDQEQDWEEALALVQRAIEVAPARTLEDMARFRAAKLLFQLDRLDASAAELANIRSAGLQTQTAELSGDIFVAKGELESAREAYGAAVAAARRDPDREEPGVAYLELKLATLVDRTQ